MDEPRRLGEALSTGKEAVQQHKLSTGSYSLEKDRRSLMKALLVNLCSKAGGEQMGVFEPGPCPETGLDVWLMGEAGVTLRQLNHGVFCSMS